MDRPTCATCVFWDRRDWLAGDEGECHGATPRPVLMLGASEARPVEPDASEYVCWPRTMAREFCPAHQGFPAYIASRRKPHVIPPDPARDAVLQELSDLTQELGDDDEPPQ